MGQLAVPDGMTREQADKKVIYRLSESDGYLYADIFLVAKRYPRKQYVDQ